MMASEDNLHKIVVKLCCKYVLLMPTLQKRIMSCVCLFVWQLEGFVDDLM